MVYHIHPTPRFSSEGPSRNNSAMNSPRLSVSSQRSGVETPRFSKNKTASSNALKRAINGMTEEYWSNPSPLYTPRGSMDMGRPTAAATSSKPATPVAQKKSFAQKMKAAVGKNTQQYWGNPEMNALYGGAAQIKI